MSTRADVSVDAPSAGKASTSGSVDPAATTKRLQSELMALMSSSAGDSSAGVSAFPAGDSLMEWTGTVEGPPGTAYEGFTYRVALTFPPDYPFKPPAVRFDCPCFHPNVDAATGAICLDILQDKWSAAYSVRTVLLSLQSLLGDANLDSPLDVVAARHYANQADFRALLLSKKAAGQQGI